MNSNILRIIMFANFYSLKVDVNIFLDFTPPYVTLLALLTTSSAFALVAKLFITGVFSLIFIVTGEMYPTSAR